MGYYDLLSIGASGGVRACCCNDQAIGKSCCFTHSRTLRPAQFRWITICQSCLSCCNCSTVDRPIHSRRLNCSTNTISSSGSGRVAHLNIPSLRVPHPSIFSIEGWEATKLDRRFRIEFRRDDAGPCSLSAVRLFSFPDLQLLSRISHPFESRPKYFRNSRVKLLSALFWG
jgi:hypothetical protein